MMDEGGLGDEGEGEGERGQSVEGQFPEEGGQSGRGPPSTMPLCGAVQSRADRSPGAISDGRGPSDPALPGTGRMQANRHRRLQVTRAGGRRLFDEAAQAEFLEWFAATCNFAWSAEMAGFNYRTVMRHRMNDARFREGCERAVEQGYARLEAKRLETRRKETPIGIEGDRDAPEMDEMEPERMDRILRERRMDAKHPEQVRRQGRRPTVASNAEVREELARRLKVYRERVRAGRASDEAGTVGEGEDQEEL